MNRRTKIVELDRPKLLRFHVDGYFNVLIQNGKAYIMESDLGGLNNPEAPTFKHEGTDNKDDIFLGNYRPWQPKEEEHKVFDGYLNGDSIIVRFGDQENDFSSMEINKIDSSSPKEFREFCYDFSRLKDALE